MSNQIEITVELGTTVGEAIEAAQELANKLYPLAPINDSRGQSFKNAFVKAWFNRSERSERAAKARFGTSEVKPVINDKWNLAVMDFGIDGDLLDEATGVTVSKEEDGTLIIVVPPQD